ncbi:MAG: Rrf2 family transcriptional regulator [Chloroflexi bacterium]|nr:Rrf2 family transcriptional regulator [Chloroflexota bacterium]
MLRINQRTEYAVRAMSMLAGQPDGLRLSTRFIEIRMLIPRPFLIRVVADLSRSGLIKTYPGRNGGLMLARSAQAISLKDIYEAVEGSLLIFDCIEKPQKCILNAGCKIRSSWCQLQAKLVAELENITLNQLAAESNSAETLSSL